jgi:hypothetical protein
MLLGNNDWNTITEASVRSIAWGSDGLSFNFTVRGIRVTAATPGDFGDNNSNPFTRARLIQLLESNLAGIVIYDTNRRSSFSPGRNSPHAILLTDYTDGVFYVSDPSNDTPRGRIPISQSLISIDSIDQIWTIRSPSIPHPTGNTPPAVPTGLTATRETDTSARISWNAVTGATSYQVQYWDWGANNWLVDVGYSSGTSYVSSGLTFQAAFTFRVRAVSPAGVSAWSAEVTYNIPPFGLTATRESDTSAKISWNAMLKLMNIWWSCIK